MKYLARYIKKLFIIQVLLLLSVMASAQDRAAWMPKAKWGIMVHYLADWISRSNNMEMSPDQWNKLVNQFNVEALADQVKSTRAGYMIFTIGQNSGYYLSPNKTYERLTGIKDHLSRRDLVADLSAALQKRGIKLIVYLPSGAPGQDSVAKKALDYKNGPYPNKEFQQKWERVIKEWSLRWGKNVVGWWFDGCYWPSIMYRSEKAPNFGSFAAAARAGNRQSVVTFNPGVVYRLISMTPHEDYTGGETADPSKMDIKRQYDGKVDGRQIHILSYIGEKWGMGQPRFTSEQLLGWSKQVAEIGGVITWDVPVQPSGLIAAPFMEQLSSVGKSFGN